MLKLRNRCRTSIAATCSALRRAVRGPGQPGAAAALLPMLLLAAGSPVARSAPAADAGLSLDDMPLPRLELFYRACDDLMARELPTLEELRHCTLVYETLKQRRFGGSTARFVKWLRQQPKPAVDAPPGRAGKSAASSI